MIQDANQNPRIVVATKSKFRGTIQSAKDKLNSSPYQLYIVDSTGENLCLVEFNDIEALQNYMGPEYIVEKEKFYSIQE